MKNYGLPAVNVEVEIVSHDPLVTVIDGQASFGDIGTGGIASNFGDPFTLEVAAYAPEARAASFTVTATYDGGQTVTSFTLLIGKYHYLVWDPSPDQSSGPVIEEALSDLGYIGKSDTFLPTERMDRFTAVFVSVGIYDSNFVIPSGSEEALALVAHIEGGGCAYLEGGDVWFYDPGIGGHNFGPHFGIRGVTDGSSDMHHAVGQPGTFTEGMNIQYAGENSYIDHLVTQGTTSHVIFNNSAPIYGCGIANDTGTYRTVGTSFEFAGLIDGTSPSTKADLAQAIMNFFMPVDPQSLPDETVEMLSRLSLRAPSLCRDKGVLRYVVAQASPVTIDLYDLNGRRVRSLVSGQHNPGTYTVDLDATALGAGMYFIRSQAAEETQVEKIVVVR